MLTERETHTFLLDDAYFASLEAPDIQHGRVTVTVEAVRLTAEDFRLTLRTEGTVTVACDRCLDDMDQPISATDHLSVSLGEAYEDEGDEQVVIPREDGTLNLAWLMYELIALAVPMKHVHAPGQCNEAMSEKLSSLMCNPADEDNGEDNGEDSGEEDGKDNGEGGGTLTAPGREGDFPSSASAETGAETDAESDAETDDGGAPTAKPTATDPRWNELKKIRDNN